MAESQSRPAAPAAPPVTEVKLTDDIKEAVNGSYAAGFPAVVAYVDPQGQPSLSLRGSTHVYSDDQLAIWVRNPESGGLSQGLKSNPRVSVLIRNNETRATLNFRTTAHFENSEEVRKKVWEAIPENERKADPDQKGMPLILDIHRLEGRTPAGQHRMAKGGA